MTTPQTDGSPRSTNAVVEALWERIRTLGGNLGVPESSDRVLPQATSIGSSTAAGLSSHITGLLSPRGVSHLTSYARGSWQISHQAAVTGTRKLAVASVTIPASGGVEVTPINMPEANNTTIYLTMPGVLAGVAGTLATAAGSPAWTFTRTNSGTSVSVPEGSEFIPTALNGRKRDVIFLNPGKNTITTNLADWGVERQITLAEKMAEDLGIAEGRVLFIGHFVNTTTAAGHSNRTKIGTFNNYFKQKYGERFFDLNGYLTGSQVWTDTGITPTQADLDEQALGNKPPSLSADNGHMNAAGYAAVAARLVERASSLGWLPAPPAPTWQVRATEDFSSDGHIPLDKTTTGNLNWTLVPGSTSIIHKKDGMSAITPAGNTAFAMLDPGVSDYRISARLPILFETPGGRNLRLVFRIQNSTNFYFLTPRQSASAEGIGLWRMVDNSPSMRGSSPIVPQPGDSLAVEVVGDVIRVFYNDEELFDRTDATFPTGPVGLYMAGSGQSFGSAWDDFVLETRA